MIAWITGWKLALAEHDGLEHLRFGQFLRLGFDHHHGIAGAGDHEVERALRHLVEHRIEHELAVDDADARGADGAEERQARQRQRGRRGDQGDDVGIILEVVARAR